MIMVRLLGSNHPHDLDKIADACPHGLEFYVDGIKQEYVKSVDEVSGELIKYLRNPGSISTICHIGEGAVEVVMRGKVEVRAAQSKLRGIDGHVPKPTIMRLSRLSFVPLQWTAP